MRASALILAAGLAVAHGYTLETCNTSPVGLVDRSDTKAVRIAHRDWASQTLLALVWGHLLRDHIRSAVEIVDTAETSLGATAAWQDFMVERDLFDLDPESWQVNMDDPSVKALISNGQIAVPYSGFSGGAGIFFTTSVLTTHKFADHHSFYATEAAKSSSFRKFVDAPVEGIENQECVYEDSWCNRPYAYIPEVCTGAPTECLEVIHASATWDTAFMEQLATTANMHVAFRYYGGSKFVQTIVDNARNDIDQLFYAYFPSEFVAFAAAQKIAFPPFVPGCTRDRPLDGRAELDCDYPMTEIRKLVNLRYSSEWKPALYLLQNFQVTEAELMDMLSLVTSGGGDLTVPEAACKIVKDWEAGGTMLAPFDCVMKPPANPVPGDIVLNENTMECGPLSTYVEEEVATQCLATDLTTEKASRSRTRIRFARRTTATQQLSTEVALLTVKELLGYTVATVDLTNESVATVFEDALVDVEVEAKGLADGTAAHTAAAPFMYSRTPVGYNDIRGLFATPAAAAEGPTVWWKFYEDASLLTGFVQSGDVTHSGAATCTDGAWCTTDWTFVPTACAGDPTQCTEVGMPAMTDGDVWAESIAENADLKMTFAYYGDGLKDQVEAWLDAGAKAVFYASKLDPDFVGATQHRITFAAYSDDCADGHTTDPTTSAVACDFQALPLHVVVRAGVERAAPEAVFALGNVVISREQINELMDAYNGATGPNKAREAACSWAAANVAVLQTYAPECVSKPKDDPQQGDFVFRLSTMTCVEVECAPGEYVEQGECRACAPGQYPARNEAGEWQCAPAPAGSYASGFMDEPALCLNGTVSETAAAACAPCPSGFFAAEEGMTECKRCPIGTYAADEGSDRCTPCGKEGFTTQESGAAMEANCGCQEGYYLNIAEDACLECPKGYVCRFGASEDATLSEENIDVARTPLLVRMGYHARAEAPMVAYRCQDFVGCGPPPTTTEIDCTSGQYKDFADDVRCARSVGTCFGDRNADAVACGRCAEGFYVGDGGVCKECRGDSAVPFVVALLVGLAAAPTVYYTTRSKQGAEATALLATGISLGMLVSLMQIVGTTTSFALPFSDSVAELLSVFSVVLLDVSALNAACLGNTATAIYSVAWIAPFYVLATAFLIWAVSKLVRYNLNGNRMFSSTGQVFQTLYITFVSIGVRPMICYPHPDERVEQSSVQSFPAVICGTDEHTPMLALSILSTLLVAVGFLVLCMWANIVARAKSVSVHGDVFLARFRFLFFRFSTTHWYWGTNLQLRSGALSFVPVFIQDNGAGQAILVTVILGVYLAAVCQTNPWKTDLLNFCDIAITILMMIFAALSIALSYPSQDVYESLSAGIISILILSLVVVAGTIANGLVTVVRHGASKPLNTASKKEIDALAKDWEAVSGATSGVDVRTVLNDLNRQDIRMLSKTLDMMQMEIRKTTGKSVSRHSKRYRIAASGSSQKAINVNSSGQHASTALGDTGAQMAPVHYSGDARAKSAGSGVQKDRAASAAPVSASNVPLEHSNGSPGATNGSPKAAAAAAPEGADNENGAAAPKATTPPASAAAQETPAAPAEPRRARSPASSQGDYVNGRRASLASC